MHTVKILKRGPISRKGIYDATIIINSKDCGILYLNEIEKNILLDLISTNIRYKTDTNEIQFETNLYPEDIDDNI